MQGVLAILFTDSQVYLFIAVQVHIKMPLGTDVCLGPGDIVLDGNPSAPPRGTAPRNFRLTSIVATKGRPFEQLLSSS